MQTRIDRSSGSVTIDLIIEKCKILYFPIIVSCMFAVKCLFAAPFLSETNSEFQNFTWIQMKTKFYYNMTLLSMMSFFHSQLFAKLHNLIIRGFNYQRKDEER